METVTVDLTEVSCWCGIHFAIPSNTYRWARQRSSNAVYCPMGHTFIYSDSIEKKLKSAEDRAATLEMELNEERRERAATERKAKRRAAAGVCSCCHRAFQNVARHMQTQHPEAVTAAKTKAPAPKAKRR